ncbi:hypothetical protein N7504_005083 [Penicillium tannophilum]|nr:hypothetical protein N7504_005083 [Penicillium tannophilum]
MSSSRIRTPFALFQRPKARWLDPEQSIGAFRGIKKGNINCWSAEGPAKEAFEHIRSEIAEVLERHCGPVPSSSWVQFDIFMVGGTKSTAVPHIMFSCKRPEPRKAAVAAIKRSNILDECPPGIHLGHWDCPPHLKDLRFLASATRYEYPDIYTSQDCQPTLSFHNNEFNSVPRIYSVGSGQALQLALKNTSIMPEYLRKATIGTIVSIFNRRFYLAPAHFYCPEGQYLLDMAPEEDSELDNSECEFGGLDDQSEESSNSQEVDFMSQYSLTPGSSDPEEDLDFDEHDSASDSKSDCLTLEAQAESPNHDIADSDDDAAYSTSDNIHTFTLLDSIPTYAEAPYLRSATLDYCLIEIRETELCPPGLPIFARENIGQIHSGSVNVLAATGSGNILKGVLFSGLSCVRPPNATRYMNVLSAEFESSLQPGDSGSIVRDVRTGMIYGHIVAGDTTSQIALIIPAFDVLNDIVAKSTCTETFSAEHDLSRISLSTLPSLELRSHGGPGGQSCQFERNLDWVNNSASSALLLDQPKTDTGANSLLLEESPDLEIAKHIWNEASNPFDAISISNTRHIEGMIDHQNIARQTVMSHTERSGMLRNEASYPYPVFFAPATDNILSRAERGLVLRDFRRMRESINNNEHEVGVSKVRPAVRDLRQRREGRSNKNKDRVSKTQTVDCSIPPPAQNCKKENCKQLFRCCQCDTRFRYVGALQRHIEDLHYPSARFCCPECNESSHRRDKFRNHCQIKHEWRPTNEEIKRYTKVIPCPPHCAICSSIVSDWKSFYHCFIRHCGIETPGQDEAIASEDDDGTDNAGPDPAPGNGLNSSGLGTGYAGIPFSLGGYNNYTSASNEEMNDGCKPFEGQCRTANTSQEEGAVFETGEINNGFSAFFGQPETSTRAYYSSYGCPNSLERNLDQASAGESNSTTVSLSVTHPS